MDRLFKITIPVLLFLFPVQQYLNAQDLDLDEEMDEIIDNIIAIDDEDLIDILEELNKYQVIFTSVDFSNKTYFLGRDIGVDQYNVGTQVMYENSNGIFAGISGTYYSQFDPKWDLTYLTLGFGQNFGKKDNIRAELSYNRYIFSNPDSNDFENSLDASFDITNNDKSIGSSIESSYFFGGKTGFQLTASVYADLDLFDLNAAKGTKVSFGPDLSFIFGSENIDTSRIDNLGIDIPFINQIVAEFETFSLRNIQLQLPIVFELNNFFIEAGYNINFPNAFEFENDIDSTSYFNLELSYIFNLK